MQVESFLSSFLWLNAYGHDVVISVPFHEIGTPCGPAAPEDVNRSIAPVPDHHSEQKTMGRPVWLTPFRGRLLVSALVVSGTPLAFKSAVTTPCYLGNFVLVVDVDLRN